ncbi:Maf-like protein [Clostridium sp. MB40-C1]|uniref:Maf-like protein n=1 Tax=Clostridium sp. MB40-C1 TaxID=3070996 RepID=UPI0027E07A70|nr:Maf-like protein [Clostridium sp. MB40-C1]WMJ81034.1 Maf-like protein [Clostridium sp. MB40-C1]
MRIVLASASIRRQELLRKLLHNFDIVVSDFDENEVEFKGDCSKYVMELAKNKALAVSNIINTDAIIIGSDTVVAYEDCMLGKPKNELEAFCMLNLLNGKVHQVYSGIAIYDSSSGELNTDYVCTKVKFSKLTEEDIKKYIATGEPMDKAGAYGIQGYGGVFVERIEGCYYNVVGLPLNKLKFMLRDMGVNL